MTTNNWPGAPGLDYDPDSGLPGVADATPRTRVPFAQQQHTELVDLTDEKARDGRYDGFGEWLGRGRANATIAAGLQASATAERERRDIAARAETVHADDLDAMGARVISELFGIDNDTSNSTIPEV